MSLTRYDVARDEWIQGFLSQQIATRMSSLGLKRLKEFVSLVQNYVLLVSAIKKVSMTGVC
jgi:hypothetical protein